LRASVLERAPGGEWRLVEDAPAAG
jgi:hypothetical protein